MGYAHIIWVHEDGVSSAKHSTDQWNRLKPALGEAVLQVVIGGSKGGKSAKVLNHGNCVNRCDEVHAADARVYLWLANCLRPLHQLDDEDFTTVEQLVSEERKRRPSLTK